MPTYVYRCDNDHRQEITHTMSFGGHFVCPKCGKSMKRVPQVVKFAFAIMDAGQKNAKEINSYLEEKYKNNKARREANQYEREVSKNGKNDY